MKDNNFAFILRKDIQNGISVVLNAKITISLHHYLPLRSILIVSDEPIVCTSKTGAIVL
jgi:hypothetical protein